MRTKPRSGALFLGVAVRGLGFAARDELRTFRQRDINGDGVADLSVHVNVASLQRGDLIL